MTGQIQRQLSSYRQGLVLGLTMAEIMLLLVFCLLIAAAVVLSKETEARRAAEERLANLQFSGDADRQLVEEIKNSPQLRELLQGASGKARAVEIDQYWRKLVEGRAASEALEREGLSAREIRDDAPYLAEAERLKREGVKLSDAKANARLVEGLREAGLDRLDDPRQIADLAVKGAEASRAAKDGHRWPPIIKLSEAEGYYFQSGRAALDPGFERLLKAGIADRLAAIVRDYDVDVVEVVGHTDEQPVGPKVSNLDKELAGVLAKTGPIDVLKPADNAGLGLARAVAVVGVLGSDPRFAGLKILPLSGAQLVQTDETLARGAKPGDVRERRRIEIRVRRSRAAVEARGDALER